MKKLLACLMTLTLLLAPVGCAKEESTLELFPYQQPSVDKNALCVNISTLKIHTDPDCRYITEAKEEHLRYAENTTDSVNILLSMGYTFCKVCQE